MPTVKKGMLASLLSVSQSVLEKLVGLVSTLILARVLVPEDFGLVAMATIFTGFINILAKTGGNQYIIRADEVNDDMLNTNWTINFILKLFISLIILFSSSYVAEFFGDERLVHILYFYSFACLVNSLNNPGVDLLHRDQNLAPIVINNLIGKIVAVITAVSIALIYESYWALILGLFISQVSRIIGGYFIHNFRPSFCLKNFKQQFSFSFWLIAQAMLGYGRTQLDSFIVASTFTQNQLGQYNIMKYIAYLPNLLVLAPATEPLLRQLSSIKHTQDHFKTSLNLSTLMIIALALACTSLMYLCSESLVFIILGEKWVEYHHLFALFALLMPAFVVFHQANRLFIVYSNTRASFIYELVSFIGIYGLILLSGIKDIDNFTILRVSLENIFSFTLLAFVYVKYTGVKNLIRMSILLAPVIIINVIAFYITNQIPLIENNFINVIARCVVYSAIVVSFFAIIIATCHSYFAEFSTLLGYIKKVVNKQFKKELI